MATKAESDDDLLAHPVQALTLSFVEFCEIYANLFDSDKPELLFDMGKTLRCLTLALSKMSLYYDDENADDDALSFEDEDEE